MSTAKAPPFFEEEETSKEERIQELEMALREMTMHATNIGESVQAMTQIVVKYLGGEEVEADNYAAAQQPRQQQQQVDFKKIMDARMEQQQQLMSAFTNKALELLQNPKQSNRERR